MCVCVCACMGGCVLVYVCECLYPCVCVCACVCVCLGVSGCVRVNDDTSQLFRDNPGVISGTPLHVKLLQFSSTLAPGVRDNPAA